MKIDLKHNVLLRNLLIILFLICLAIVVFWYPFKEDTANKYYCDVDSDCVPEQCCHPTSCINKAYSPDCPEVVCTMECAPDTLDCGQGSCQCLDNKCTAVIE